MTNKEIQKIGNRMVITIRVINISARDFKKTGSKEMRPLNRFDYEINGMVQMLKTLNCDVDFSYDDEVVECTGLSINGNNFIVKEN